jgi:DNA polymerase-3 subunit delta'
VTSLLSTLEAQPAATETIRRALRTGRVHHAYLFDGPDGVGKELAAFGLAQALVCEKRGERGDEACGACSACVRARVDEESRRPKHPDIVVLERGLYEPAQLGRRTPETQDLSIDQVRTLVLSHAAYAPHEGRARVFIVRRAEELSIAAANALLKTLEEPNARTHFILVTAQPDTLLPTIRSRTQRVRFGALPEEVVASIVTRRGVPAETARKVAALAEGSVETALSLADETESAERDAFVQQTLAAIRAPTFGAAFDLAERAKRDKATLRLHLLAFGAHLAHEVKRGVLEGAKDVPALWADGHAHVLEALRDLDSNASPQLVVETLVLRLRA